MTKALVIVESPNKVKTINKYLGSDYIVASSIGHIRDLQSPPSSEIPSIRGKKLSPTEKLDIAVLKMGINPVNWDGNFQVMEDKVKVVKELKKLASQCETIYLATDLDREGEAIAWHLQEVLGTKNHYYRVIFNEITQSAVTAAFKNPTLVNMDRVHAQQTRRYLDRMVGFLISPLLWAKAGRGLSAGRVQSVATRLIVEREREIRVFVPVEFWKINGLYKSFNFDLLAIDDKKLTSPEDKKPFFIANQEECDRHLELINQAKAEVLAVETKDTKVSPKAPFTTSTLQQSASTRLGFGIRRTMSIAQRLYENGLITYMRTDSTNLSEQAVSMATKFITNEYGAEYLDTSRQYTSNNENSQEAHEAIRPTSLGYVALASAEEQKLYNLIKSQFLASQMKEAIYLNTTISCQVDNQHIYSFKTSAKLLKFAGFYRAFGVTEDDIVDLSGGMKVGGTFKLRTEANQNFTQPPARYSEATLVKELEKRSIGRPSTYVSIVTTIQDRGYVTLENKKFYATKIAEIVNDRLEKSFANILDYDFTAQMEAELDQIASGEKEWTDEMTQFWSEFRTQVAFAQLSEDEGGMPTKKAIPTSYLCPECKTRHMNLVCSKQGNFLTCSGYDLKGEDRCKNTVSLIDALLIMGKDYVAPTERCPKCNSLLEEYFINPTTKIQICSNISRCDYTNIIEGKFIDDQQTDAVLCDKCGTPMQMTVGRFGKYLTCPSCDNKRSILPSGEVAPPKPKAIEFPELPCKAKNAHFVLRHSAKGIFLGANTFPRCREVKTLEVAILKQFRDRLTPDLYYLADGPTEDYLGNPTVVRYSVKTATQYIGSQTSDGKFTKWRADYENGVWIDNTTELTEKAQAKLERTAKATAKKATTKKTTSITKATKTSVAKKTTKTKKVTSKTTTI